MEGKAIMTPEAFATAMLVVKEDNDMEERHQRADALLCEVLRSLGYGEGVEVFESLSKWYA